MAFNSYKEDEQTSHVKKSATLLRLFSYLLAYKKNCRRTPHYGVLCGGIFVKPAHHGSRH